MVTTTQQRHGLHFEQDTVAARLIINYQRGIGRVKTCGQVPVDQHNHLLNHVKENIKMDYNSIPFKNNVIDRLMSSDTTKPKMDTLMKFKRVIGDTAAQMKRAEELGLKSASDKLKQRLAEKKKQ